MLNSVGRLLVTANRRLARDECGATAVIMAIMIPVLLALTALAFEAGLWYTIQRQNQNAADAAAITAAYEIGNGMIAQLCNQNPANCNTTPIVAQITPAAALAASQNGFPQQAGLTPIICVTWPYPGGTTYSSSGTCPGGLNGPDNNYLFTGNSSYSAVAAYVKGTYPTILAWWAGLTNVGIAARAVALTNIQSECVDVLAIDPQGIGISLAGNTSVDLGKCAAASDPVIGPGNGGTCSSGSNQNGSICIQDANNGCGSTGATGGSDCLKGGGLISAGAIMDGGTQISTSTNPLPGNLQLSGPAYAYHAPIWDPYSPPQCGPTGNGDTCYDYASWSSLLPSAAGDPQCTSQIDSSNPPFIVFVNPTTPGTAPLYNGNCWVSANNQLSGVGAYELAPNVQIEADQKCAGDPCWDIKGQVVNLSAPGTYWVTDGDLYIDTGGTLECTSCNVNSGAGVTIILTSAQASGGTVGNFVMQSTGATLNSLNAPGPKSGQPFPGLLIAQDYDSDASTSFPNGEPGPPKSKLTAGGPGCTTSNPCSVFQGSPSAIFTGLLHFPDSNLQFNGGSTTTGSVCLLLIAGSISFNGTSAFNDSGCAPVGIAQVPVGTTVALAE